MGMAEPVQDPQPVNEILTRNIDALAQKRRDAERRASLEDRTAAVISAFAGSLAFVWLHLAILLFWVLANLGLVPGVPRFDPQFIILATTASVEAIFLSTFILIAQNRAAQLADRRSELDVQISLLTEHEVTRLLSLVSEIAARLEIDAAHAPDLHELKKDIEPEAVMEVIADRENAKHGARNP
jgi:uncharacterized membrane protein